jgi:hypothetical protein
MAYLLSKNPNLGKFGRVLQWKMLVYYMGICYILWPFDIFCGYLLYFVIIWHIFSRFGTLYKENIRQRCWEAAVD